MSDTNADIGRSLSQSLGRRLQRVTPRPDLEQLLGRLDRRSSRQRNLLLSLLVAATAIAAVFAYTTLTSDSSSETAIVVPNDGVPDSAPSRIAIEPENVAAAQLAIGEAFHDAFDGATPAGTRRAATQRGGEIEDLRRQAIAIGVQHGYSEAQLAGTTITVLDVKFVDATHAAVHFTLTIPDHGAVLVDQVGYAVFDGGRWQVALRTACDLLSLSGLSQPCPPAP
jgi:hypothetical protein